MEKLSGRWRQLGRPKQVTYVILLAAAVAFFYFLYHLTAKPNYAILFTNMDPNQAAPLVSYLREKGVAYRLDDFGTTLKVPQELVHELRIDLAGKGMPLAQGLGFELFDEERLGMTDFERQVKLQRALQEELRRTITSLDAVLQARIHLVLPEPRVFLRDRAEPSAAVYLKINPLAQLKEDQVRGIVHLVASSVENLKPENVTVIDAKGTILYDGASSANPLATVSGAALQQLEVKRNFEKELERRVEAVLERVFGPGRALVVVNAEMDFDAREITVLRYETEPVPRSTQLVQEAYEGVAPAPGEVGEANIPGYVSVVSGGAGSYERREEITNYEVGEISEVIVTAPGKVVRLHTSVVVDSGPAGFVSQNRIDQVNELVTSAIGFSAERGDRISVQSMSFDTSVAEEIEAAAVALAQREQEAHRRKLIQQGITVGAGLAALLIVVLFAWRIGRREEEAPFADVPQGPPLEEILAARSKEFAEEEAVLEETANLRAKEMIKANPDVSVSVLRTWLVEEN